MRKEARMAQPFPMTSIRHLDSGQHTWDDSHFIYPWGKPRALCSPFFIPNWEPEPCLFSLEDSTGSLSFFYILLQPHNYSHHCLSHRASPFSSVELDAVCPAALRQNPIYCKSVAPYRVAWEWLQGSGNNTCIEFTNCSSAQGLWVPVSGSQASCAEPASPGLQALLSY